MADKILTALISPGLVDIVTTKADDGSPISRQIVSDEQVSEQWQNVLDRLIEWGCNPDAITDDGIDPPSPDTLKRAAKLATALRAAGQPAPSSVLPDPNGGIVFEYDDGQVVFHVWDDGEIEWYRFDGNQLVERHRI